MDIRDLKLFRHLAGSLHYARTSKACHITPSALTRLIQRLESDLGKKLFHRSRRSVELTPAGLAFKTYCDDVISRWDSLKDEISTSRQIHGSLSIYCSVTAAYGILPPILEKYREVNPCVKLHIETGDQARALDKLMSHDADVVVAALPDALPGELVFKKILITPLIFIVSKRHSDMVKYRGHEIDWENIPLIIPDHGLSRKRIDRWIARQHFVPDIYSMVAGNEAIIAMVSLGFGVGLVPRMVLEKSPLKNTVSIVKHAPELPAFTIGLCTRKKNIPDTSSGSNTPDKFHGSGFYSSNPRISSLWEITGLISGGSG